MDQFFNEPKPIDEVLLKLQNLSVLPEDKNQKTFDTKEVDGFVQNECKNLVQSLQEIIIKVDDKKYTAELENLQHTFSNLQVGVEKFSDFNQAIPSYQNQIDVIKQRVNDLEQKANSIRINAYPQTLNGLILVKAEMLSTEKSQSLGMTYAIKLEFINQQEFALHNISLKLAQNPNVTLVDYEQIGVFQTITQLLNIERPIGEMIFQGGISFCGQSGEKVDAAVPYYAKISDLKFYEGYCSVMVQNTSFIDFNQEHGMTIYVQQQPVANVQTLRPFDQKQEIVFNTLLQDNIQIFLAANINGQLQIISNTVQQSIDNETLFIQTIEQEVLQLQLQDDMKQLYKSACTNLQILKDDPKQRNQLIQNFYGCPTVQDCWIHVAALTQM